MCFSVAVQFEMIIFVSSYDAKKSDTGKLLVTEILSLKFPKPTKKFPQFFFVQISFFFEALGPGKKKCFGQKII